MAIIHKVPGFKSIYAYKIFDKEFSDLFKNETAAQKRYQNWLDKRLQILDVTRYAPINQELFEPIEHNINSIRHPRSKHNPRILFTLCFGPGRAVLLVAFLEKNSADYELAKRKARNRINLIRRELDL